jgi:hypothetical protein
LIAATRKNVNVRGTRVYDHGMRLVGLGLFLVVAACTEHGKGGAVVCRHLGQTHFPGDFFPAGDGCNFCECTSDGRVGRVACSEQACTDGGVPVPGSCTGSFDDGCAGPICGGICCGQGESCELGQCSCGGGAPCISGDLCAPAGPVGGDACGIVCCGSTGPCPQ